MFVVIVRGIGAELSRMFPRYKIISHVIAREMGETAVHMDLAVASVRVVCGVFNLINGSSADSDIVYPVLAQSASSDSHHRITRTTRWQCKSSHTQNNTLDEKTQS